MRKEIIIMNIQQKVEGNFIKETMSEPQGKAKGGRSGYEKQD
jgi:hypothetical protein